MTLVACALACLGWLGAGIAQAQETVADPGAGRYMSGFWLFVLILQLAVWMGIYDWVGRDSERLGTAQSFWSGIIMATGAAGAILALLRPGFLFFSFLGIIALGMVFALYVIKRNLAVGEEQRVFTLKHLNYLLRVFQARFHLRKSAGAMAQRKMGPREDTTTIQLLRKDGASLERLTEGRTDSASEAVISVKELIESAVVSRATDIHLEPKENELQARFRIDGILHNVPSYPTELGQPMLSSIKVLSDMDIAEKRKPQDGSFMGKFNNRTLDFRVATAPTVHGETMVVRVLDRDAGLLRLEKLGMLQDHLKVVRRVIQYPHGMLAVCGPTGSGKTTTLYAMLSEIDAFQKNIITIEDPIEYRLDNVSQTPVNVKAGITFASALRSSLRQDPDVIMVGEIRDAETARVACQAAMTGHFVFTTLHANDSITSLFRLLDLGVEAYFIASSLTASLSQRLVRVLCPNCKAAYVPEPDFLQQIGLPPDKQVELYKSVGCEACQGTGYQGRIGIYEVVEINDPIRELLRTNPSLQAITAEAKKAGFRKLQDDGLAKVIKGITSLKELVRVTR